MAEHPAVRRLKGQPDRWRRSVEREQHDIVRIKIDLTAVRAALADRPQSTPFGDAFGRWLDRFHADLEEGSRRAGEQIAAFLLGADHHGRPVTRRPTA